MDTLSVELITHFFRVYPRLDFLFHAAFSEKKTAPEQKALVFSETSAFIRLFPAFAYKQGIAPFGGALSATLIQNAIKKFDPLEHSAFLQELSFTEMTARTAAECFALPLPFTEALWRTYDQEFISWFLKRSVLERPLYLRKIRSKETEVPELVPVNHIPGAYRFAGRILDFKDPWFKKGIYTIQDLSGQLACLLINPKPGGKVLDACAGNGGKSLVLAALMRGKGELCALHQKASEYRELKQRLRSYDVQNVRQIQLAPGQEPDLLPVFDIVLVDVPCSGTGVIRRNPDLIYRIQSLDLTKFTANQLAILKTYSRFVKPGGRLVYTTCSVMGEENQGVITAFLKEVDGLYTERDFSAGKNYYQLESEDNAIQTLGGSADPDCDGFFLAGLARG